jgi:hypothetical protein
MDGLSERNGWLRRKMSGRGGGMGGLLERNRWFRGEKVAKEREGGQGERWLAKLRELDV